MLIPTQQSVYKVLIKLIIIPAIKSSKHIRSPFPNSSAVCPCQNASPPLPDRPTQDKPQKNRQKAVAANGQTTAKQRLSSEGWKTKSCRTCYASKHQAVVLINKVFE